MISVHKNETYSFQFFNKKTGHYLVNRFSVFLNQTKPTQTTLNQFEY